MRWYFALGFLIGVLLNGCTSTGECIHRCNETMDKCTAKNSRDIAEFDCQSIVETCLTACGSTTAK